jgi:Fe-S-cluster containining protein
MPDLQNYRTLLERVDRLCDRTWARFGSQISCRPGCDLCCRHLSIFAVEAQALRVALAALTEPEARFIRQKGEDATPNACPLLHDGLCLLYQARPIICRTHGLPLLISRDGESVVDFCPENFRDLPSIQGSEVIDLDRLNAILVTINTVYINGRVDLGRITVAQALTMTGETAVVP